jgi:hypothetical protein
LNVRRFEITFVVRLSQQRGCCYFETPSATIRARVAPALTGWQLDAPHEAGLSSQPLNSQPMRVESERPVIVYEKSEADLRTLAGLLIKQKEQDSAYILSLYLDKAIARYSADDGDPAAYKARAMQIWQQVLKKYDDEAVTAGDDGSANVLDKSATYFESDPIFE